MLMQPHIGRFGLAAVVLVTAFSAGAALADNSIPQVTTYRQNAGGLPLSNARYITNSSDFHKRRSRKTRYHGPGLDFNQINKKQSPAKSVEAPYQKTTSKPSDFRQRQLGTNSLSTFTHQLRARRKLIPNVIVPKLLVKKPLHCDLPPGNYAIEGLMIPTIPGVPKIAIINSLLKRDDEKELYDPTRLFIKPATKEEEQAPDHGITIETAPGEKEITVEVSQN